MTPQKLELIEACERALLRTGLRVPRLSIVYACDEQGVGIVLACTGDAVMPSGHHVTLSNGLVGLALQSGATRVLDLHAGDVPYHDARRIKAAGYRGVIVVPLPLADAAHSIALCGATADHPAAHVAAFEQAAARVAADVAPYLCLALSCLAPRTLRESAV